ncbi:MAG: hypothetical protein ACLRFK_01825 [Alphaproteobacteria bacterium]
MSKECVSSFGCFDGMIARRLLRRGPAEIESLYDNPSPLMRAIVEYKWRQEPDVKLARQLNWLLRCAKYVGPQEYKQARKEMLAAIKEGSNGNLTGYREFVKLIDNPQIGKRYDDFVSELIENSPKTKRVVLKLSARDDELSKFNLDYRSDYIANDSKIFDIIGVQAIFLWAFCKRGLDLKFKHCLIRWKLENDKVRLACIKFLLPDNKNIVDLYQNVYEDQQELYQEVSKIYQNTIKEVRSLYQQTEKDIDEKYQGIARYKELIRTKQLAPFKKK